ncbi:MAG: hypothetical protein R2690_08155 [Acidimicrobiales bacterium]
MQKLEYKYGPITVHPGQNSIEFSGADVPRPDVDGWLVGIKPDLERADGTVPPVDELHLHHGVWLNLSRQDATTPRLPERIFAAGEEKTFLRSPPGFGYRYDADDNLLINYMLHNLWPTEEQAYITYTFWLIPADHPSAEGIREARPIWMDVVNGSVYPVFDVLKGSADDGTFTYPDDVPDAYRGEPLNEWTVDRDSVIIGTGGHLHPGGLTVDLDVRRDGVEAANPPSRTTRSRSSRRSPSTTSRPAPCRGRVDDGRPARVPGGGQEGRRAVAVDHLRQRPGVVVRVDGHHGAVHGRRHRRRRPVPGAGRVPQGALARAPRRERQPRRPDG